jgi:hypothetical protein
MIRLQTTALQQTSIDTLLFKFTRYRNSCDATTDDANRRNQGFILTDLARVYEHAFSRLMMPPLFDPAPCPLSQLTEQQKGMREAMPTGSENDGPLQTLPLAAEARFVVVKSPKKMESLCMTDNGCFYRQRTA